MARIVRISRDTAFAGTGIPRKTPIGKKKKKKERKKKKPAEKKKKQRTDKKKATLVLPPSIQFSKRLTCLPV